MGRTNYTGSSPGFVVDPASVVRSDGRQIAWEYVDTARIPSGLTKKVIPSSTVMAELSDGRIIPRADVAYAAALVGSTVAGTETARSFLTSDMQEDSRVQSLSGCGEILGGVLYRELMADRDETNFNDWITEIVERGSQVRLETYSDSRAA